ncbi:MAG: hypothetical protein PHH48_02870 [Eubacteriales bacterium]|nr:hypothetical protein [Eubacteriales bacterium]
MSILMTFFKIIFSVLLCFPLGYVFVLLFSKIADEVVKGKR